MGAIIKSPFGWILDAEQFGFSPAVLYRRGINFQDALYDLNFMYLNFLHHDDKFATMEDVCQFHNVDINKFYNNPEIKTSEDDGVLIREFYNHIRDCFDITAYKDCDNFTVYITLLTKKDFKSINIQKLKYVANSLIFLDVVRIHPKKAGLIF